jgi:CHAT domain-containing protein
MKQYFEKQMIILLLKALIIILLFNPLTAYADEPDDSGTLHTTSDMMQLLEEKRIKVLASFIKKQQLITEKWRLKRPSAIEERCVTQYLQEANELFKEDDFSGVFSLSRKVLKGGCPKEFVMIVKDKSCLMQLQQADKQIFKANHLIEGLQSYQEVLKAECSKDLLNYAQEKFCLALFMQYTQVKADDIVGATRVYQKMLTESCSSYWVTQAKRQILVRCEKKYQEVNQQEKKDQFIEALPLYQQMQTAGCQHTTLNHFLQQRTICLTAYQKIIKQVQANHFPEVSQFEQLKEACKNNSLARKSLLFILTEMGDSYKTQQRFAQAKKVYQKLLSIMEKQFGEKDEILSIILDRLARLSYELAEYQDAKKRWEEQLSIEKKSDVSPGLKQTRMANVLINLAKIDKKWGHYAKAESRLKRALDIYERYRSEAMNVYGLMAHLTTLYLQMGEFKELELLLKRVLDICEKVESSKAEECVLLQEVLWATDKMQGKYANAESTLKKIAQLKEESYGSAHEQKGHTLRNLAILYASIGDYSQAEWLFKQVLDIQQNVYPPEQTEILEIQRDLAMLVYKPLGEYDEVEKLLKNNVLAVYEKVYGPAHSLVAKTLESLASVYTMRGDYEQSKVLYQRAISIYETIYNSQHPDVAYALHNLADTHIMAGNQAYNQFESYSVQAGLHEKAKQALKITLAEYTQAYSLLKRALAIHNKLHYGSHALQAPIILSKLALLNEKVSYYAALPIITNTENPEWRWITLGNLGVFLAKENNRSAAIFFDKQATNLVKKWQSSHQMPSDKTLQRGFIKEKAIFFKHLIYLLIEQKRLPEALQVIQMFKEQEYFDFVQGDTGTDLPTSQVSYTDFEQVWADRYTAFTQELALLWDEKRDLERQAEPSLSETVRLAELERALTEKSRLFWNELTTAFKQAEEKAAVRKTPKEAENNLQELQNTLSKLGHGAVLIYYLVFENKLMIMLITPDEQVVHEVALSEEELNKHIDYFMTEILPNEEDAQAQAQVLYNLLIKPIANNLAKASAKTLMVSLDGTLRSLPMAALHDGQHYLVERYAILRYTQSAKKTLQHPPKPRLWRVAGFGVSNKVRDGLQALGEVKEELEQIVRKDANDLDGVLPGVIYLNEKFTAKKMQEVLKENYPLLHIASHFELDSFGTDLSSFLLLGDNSKLTLATIRKEYNFKGVDLLTLSACDTAVGIQTGNGREIESFAVLAQNKGANGVLATLWTVDSQSTHQLMPTFYRLRTDPNLALTKAEALQKAQIAFIHDDKYVQYAHPYYWAAFILMGNWL